MDFKYKLSSLAFWCCAHLFYHIKSGAVFVGLSSSLLAIGGDGVHFGLTAIPVRDLTGDGYPEIASLAPEAQTHQYHGCLVFLDGRLGVEVRRLFLKREEGRIAGGPSRLSDLDGDGHEEFAIVVAPYEDPRRRDVVIYSGADLVPVRSHKGFRGIVGPTGAATGGYILFGESRVQVFGGADGVELDSVLNSSENVRVPVLVRGDEGNPQMLVTTGLSGADGPGLTLTSAESGKPVGEVSLWSSFRAGVSRFAVARSAANGSGECLVAVGQPDFGGGRGRVQFWSVQAGETTLASELSPADFLPAADEETRENAGLGFSVINISDLDGDGISEWLIGAPASGFHHFVVAYSPKKKKVLWKHKNVWGGPQNLPMSSIGVGAFEVPDANGDGTRDLVVLGGDYNRDAYIDSTGSVRLLSGADGAALWVAREVDVFQVDK